jgi:metallo-beta-lactamase family protein
MRGGFCRIPGQGTLGRILVDRAVDTVSLFNEDIAVKCQIYSVRGLSSHADRDGLLEYARAFDPKPEKIFVVHGESEVCIGFAETLRSEGFDAVAPKFTAVYDVLEGEFAAEGVDLDESGAETEPAAAAGLKGKAARRKESPVYQRLLLAGGRLMDVIARNYGGSNRDLSAFADQINKLADRWDR